MRLVVLAGNAYLMIEPRRRPIMPIANFIVATEPLSEAEAKTLIPNDVCVCDTKFVVNYFRLSADRRLLWGGGERYNTHPPADIGAFVQPYLARVYPQYAHKRIDYAGAACWPLPRAAAGAWARLFAHGYSAGRCHHGLGWELIAEAGGTAERFDVFAAIRHQTFPAARCCAIHCWSPPCWYALRTALARFVWSIRCFRLELRLQLRKRSRQSIPARYAASP
jgi:gamma-glutamylputrescine oxidase